MGTTNVLIVEPDLGHQERFEACLSNEIELAIVGIGPNLVSSCQSNYPPKPVDVLLINIDSIEMTRMGSWVPIHVLLPGVRIVGLVSDVDDLILKAALSAGVIGIHRLCVSSSILCRAIRQAAKGIPDYDQIFAERIKKLLLQSEVETQIQHNKLAIEPLPLEVVQNDMSISMTRRENHILALVSQGLSNREIGNKLHLSEKTVRNYMSCILSKLGLKNRTQAAVWAWKNLAANNKLFTRGSL